MTATVTEAFSGSATIGTTEYSCPNASTTLTPRTDEGWFEVTFDTANLAAGDQFQFRLYEKVTSGGTQRLFYEAIMPGAQADTLLFPPRALKHGWDVTIKKLAGTDRSISWSIRQP